MSKTQAVVQAIVAGIKEDIVNFGRYQQLLAQQQVLMQVHETELLSRLNARHEKYHLGLLAQANKRQAQLISLGLPADESGMERLFGALNQASATRVRQLWQQLEALICACKAQNDINGELLAGQQELLNKIMHPEKSGEYYPADCML